jgi:hypothetical protein
MQLIKYPKFTLLVEKESYIVYVIQSCIAYKQILRNITMVTSRYPYSEFWLCLFNIGCIDLEKNDIILIQSTLLSLNQSPWAHVKLRSIIKVLCCPAVHHFWTARFNIQNLKTASEQNHCTYMIYLHPHGKEILASPLGLACMGRARCHTANAPKTFIRKDPAAWSLSGSFPVLASSLSAYIKTMNQNTWVQYSKFHTPRSVHSTHLLG